MRLTKAVVPIMPKFVNFEAIVSREEAIPLKEKLLTFLVKSSKPSPAFENDNLSLSLSSVLILSLVASSN